MPRINNWEHDQVGKKLASNTAEGTHEESWRADDLQVCNMIQWGKQEREKLSRLMLHIVRKHITNARGSSLSLGDK